MTPVGTQTLRLQRISYAAALIALFVAAAGFRFLSLRNGFANDHFLHLANAQQMLYGDWPTRDFLDPGLPLMYATSAVAQLMLGRTLFAEGVLVSVAFALAAVLTAAAVRALTGSRVLAIVAAVLEVAIMPRAYGYPKLLLYAAAFVLMQRYVTRPTMARLFALATATAIAFLFRHDHGLYLGVAGGLAALVVRPFDEVPRTRRALTFVGMVTALLAPYVLYVQMNGGLLSYLRVGLEFRRVELARQTFEWPSLFGDRHHEAVLFFGYWAIPIATALVLLARRREDGFQNTLARVAPIGVVALLLNWTFLRDPLTGRLPDAIVPVVTLGAWLTACAWRARHRWVWGPMAVLVILVSANSIMQVGAVMDHATRAGLLMPRVSWMDLMADVAKTLQEPFSKRVLPSRASAALAPFYPYVQRCTTPDHRLLVVGSLTEVLFFTQRAYAGGQAAFVQGYYESEPYQRAVLAKVGHEIVPFVLIPGESYADAFDATFPLVAEYVRQHYEPLATFGTEASTGVQVLFDRRLPIPARDKETGWPCLKT